MKRLSKRALVAGLLVVSLGVGTMAQATPAGQVRFRTVDERWQVVADGEEVESYDNPLEAWSKASVWKMADPTADVRVRHGEEFVAELAGVPSSTTTTAPPVTTTTTSTATTATTTTTTTAPAVTSTTTAPSTTAPSTTSTPTTVTGPSTTTTPTPTTAATTTTTTSAPLPPRVLGRDNTPPSPNWARPALGVPYADPAYGPTVRRLTSAEGTRFNRNVYSRRQAENADGRYFFSYHGSATYRVYATGDGAEIATLDIHPDAEPQWHPTDPRIVRHTAGSNSYVGDLRLYETNVLTGRTTVVADLTDEVRRVMPTGLYLSDGAEGSPSADGNRYAWMILDRSEELVGLVSYDLGRDRLLGWRTDLTAEQRASLDAISMSPRGDHVVAQFYQQTINYDAELSNPRPILAGAEHSDTMMGSDGDDYYVYIDFVTASPNAGWAVAHNLRTGAKTRLFNLYDKANTSIHFSGKAFDQPGWVVVSTYNCKVPGAWSCNKVVAVNVHNGIIVNLAHTYNCGENYWTETHASVNRSLERIYFNSDSGSCGSDAEVFRVDVPGTWRLGAE